MDAIDRLRARFLNGGNGSNDLMTQIYQMVMKELQPKISATLESSLAPYIGPKFLAVAVQDVMEKLGLSSTVEEVPEPEVQKSEPIFEAVKPKEPEIPLQPQAEPIQPLVKDESASEEIQKVEALKEKVQEMEAKVESLESPAEYFESGSDFIRKYLAKHPTASNDEIHGAGASLGLKFSYPLVAIVASKVRAVYKVQDSDLKRITDFISQYDAKHPYDSARVVVAAAAREGIMIRNNQVVYTVRNYLRKKVA